MFSVFSSIAVADPKNARSLLRSGAFAGLRASVRAIGDYAAERGAGKEAGNALVTGFFKELEGLDQVLLAAERSEDPSEGRELARERLDKTIAALDKVIESVPPEALNNAQRVVSSLKTVGELEENAGEKELDAAELKRLEKLF